MLSKEDFKLLKSKQFCDNASCSSYHQLDADNIRTNSSSKGQVYCKICKNMWVLTKGTMFYGLKTPMEKIINVLLLLVRGMGLRNTCRQEKVTTDSAVSWVERAAIHSNEFTEYMQNQMHIEQVQIDEFWSFIRKKRKSLQMQSEHKAK